MRERVPSPRLLPRRPSPGESIRLTLDVNLQRAAENALRYGIQLAQNNGQWAADGGAIVALDPRDGSIRAMASAGVRPRMALRSMMLS